MELGDQERSNLVHGEAPDPVRPGKNQNSAPDWGRYGLISGEQVEPEHEADESECNELYSQDRSLFSKPWWQSNFLISTPVFFGTWDGVFTSSMINIFGIIIFLRTGWVVGNAGIGLTILIILVTVLVALIAAFSAIGVCERCHMESGGVYFLLSHVLGAKVGASIGVVYCFGMAVACSLYVVGFGESVAGLMNQHNNVWISRGIGASVIVLLLGINVAGVKWVIRLQLVLLMVLFVAMLDFLVGSFVHSDPKNGFIGYEVAVLKNNTGPSFLPGETFFSVFGVFFPTATGVYAGINMSGDLQQPSKNIPFGTLAAVGVSTLLYLAFALVLAFTCERPTLQTDYLIAEKVSIVGVLFLAGLYISSISSCMGTLYGAPRILQCIALDQTIPHVGILGQGKGANRVPVYALILVTGISLIFVFVGQVNTLGPIVTMPFMLTYAAVDYAYFALAMSYDKKKVYNRQMNDTDGIVGGDTHQVSYGTVNKNEDLDSLFPERIDHTEEQTQDSQPSWRQHQLNVEVTSQPRSFYSIFCNRWLSLVGSVSSILIMFGITWYYALATIAIAAVLYIYISQANPGVFPGIADFSIFLWIWNGILRCCRPNKLPTDQYVVTPGVPAVDTMASQLTSDNEDFADRSRYHQSEVLRSQKFDDLDD